MSSSTSNSGSETVRQSSKAEEVFFRRSEDHPYDGDNDGRPLTNPARNLM